MARVVVGESEIRVHLTRLDRFAALFFGQVATAPLAAVTSVSLVDRPTRDWIDATVVIPWINAEFAGFRPRSVFPRTTTHDGGRACLVTSLWTPAVRVDFDRERSPWALFVVSDPRAETVVREIREALRTGS